MTKRAKPPGWKPFEGQAALPAPAITTWEQADKAVEDLAIFLLNLKVKGKPVRINNEQLLMQAWQMIATQRLRDETQ